MHDFIRFLMWGALAVSAVGCAPSETRPAQLSWAAEARPTWGDVRVMPVLAVHDEVPVNLASFLGPPLPEHRARQRERRTWQLQTLVPTSVGWSLPGEINGALGHAWTGQFQGDRFPTGSVERLRSALEGQRDLDEALGTVARSVGGNATLFSWVREVHGEPLSSQSPPGYVVQSAVGPVMLHTPADEPYLVTARIGVALVASDGEVVVRYEDHFQGVLEGTDSVHRTGRALARGVATEVSKLWAVDPRLMEHEPDAPAPRGPRDDGRTMQPERGFGPAAFAPVLP